MPSLPLARFQARTVLNYETRCCAPATIRQIKVTLASFVQSGSIVGIRRACSSTSCELRYDLAPPVPHEGSIP